MINLELSTRMAMGGSMTYRESLSKRLDIIRPTLQQVRCRHAGYLVPRPVDQMYLLLYMLST